MAAADRSLWSGRGKGLKQHYGRSLSLGRLGPRAAAVSDRLLSGLHCFLSRDVKRNRRHDGAAWDFRNHSYAGSLWALSRRSNLREGRLWQRWLFLQRFGSGCVHILCLRCRGALWVWRDTRNSVRRSFVSMFSRDVMILSTSWYHDIKTVSIFSWSHDDIKR